jgi:hypothetical protein
LASQSHSIEKQIFFQRCKLRSKFSLFYCFISNGPCTPPLPSPSFSARTQTLYYLMNACVHTYTKPQTSSTRSRGPGWRIHGSVEDTKLSTNKQHTLSLPPYLPSHLPARTQTLPRGPPGGRPGRGLRWGLVCFAEVLLVFEDSLGPAPPVCTQRLPETGGMG